MPFRVIVFAVSGATGILKLSGPVNVVLVCLNFNTKLSAFVFSKFMGSIPLAVRRTTAVSNYGALRACFLIMFPILGPAAIAITVLGAV